MSSGPFGGLLFLAQASAQAAATEAASTLVQVSPWVDIATRLGVPTAILVAVLYYHVRIVREKDAELARVNEQRVAESKAHAERMYEREKTQTELFGEVDKTLTLLLERIR